MECKSYTLGGAIYIDATSESSEILTISGCLFNNCSTVSGGGGIYYSSISPPWLQSYAPSHTVVYLLMVEDCIYHLSILLPLVTVPSHHVQHPHMEVECILRHSLPSLYTSNFTSCSTSNDGGALYTASLSSCTHLTNTLTSISVMEYFMVVVILHLMGAYP